MEQDRKVTQSDGKQGGESFLKGSFTAEFQKAMRAYMGDDLITAYLGVKQEEIRQSRIMAKGAQLSHLLYRY